MSFTERNTVATRARVQLMVDLIEELRDKPTMLRDEIHFFLGFSPSACRKYIIDLRRAKVIIDAGNEPGKTPFHKGQLIFAINPDVDLVDAFLAKLTEAGPAMPARQVAKALPGGDNPNRHIHIMADDVSHPFRLSRRIPAPDPLLAHLFGFAGVAA